MTRALTINLFVISMDRQTEIRMKLLQCFNWPLFASNTVVMMMTTTTAVAAVILESHIESYTLHM